MPSHTPIAMFCGAGDKPSEQTHLSVWFRNTQRVGGTTGCAASLRLCSVCAFMVESRKHRLLLRRFISGEATGMFCTHLERCDDLQEQFARDPMATVLSETMQSHNQSVPVDGELTSESVGQQTTTPDAALASRHCQR